MLRKSKPIEIDNAQPFKHDKLDREKCAEIISHLIESATGPFVLSINASWGRGKTTFLQMLSASIIDKAPVLHFNAWETDFSENPLLSFIGELDSQMTEGAFNNKDTSKSKEILNRVKNSCSSLLKVATPISIKLATMGAINGIEELKETFDFDPNADDALGDFLCKLSSEKIKEYQSQKQSLITLKESLEEFSVSAKKEGSEFPLIVIVDELDRCKPTYAIELLETIKHIFNVPGVVFVLAIDKSQLESSLKSVYGEDLDTDGYLRRFIDLEYQLPTPTPDRQIDYLFDSFHLKDLLKTKGYVSQNYTDHILIIFKQLSSAFNLTPRVIDQCFLQIEIILAAIPNKNKHETSIIYTTFLIALKAFDSNYYENFIAGKQDFKLLHQDTKINNKILSHFLNKENYGIALSFFIEFCFYDINTMSKYINGSHNMGESKQGIHDQVVGDIFSTYNCNHHKSCIDLVQLTESFAE